VQLKMAADAGCSSKWRLMQVEAQNGDCCKLQLQMASNAGCSSKWRLMQVAAQNGSSYLDASLHHRLGRQIIAQDGGFRLKLLP
jgi:hypothetical protein